MKKIISLSLLFLSVLLAFSCSQSNQKKAEAVIRKYMSENLPDYSSYKPLTTRIDSAFRTPLFDDRTLQLASLCANLKEAIQYFEEPLEKAMKEKDKWKDDTSPSGRENYEKAKQEYDFLFPRIVNGERNFLLGTQKLSQHIDSLDHEFIGWTVRHSFEAKDVQGKKRRTDGVFVMDKDFQDVIYSLENAQIDQYIEVVSIALLSTPEQIDSLLEQSEELLIWNELVNQVEERRKAKE